MDLRKSKVENRKSKVNTKDDMWTLLLNFKYVN